MWAEKGSRPEAIKQTEYEWVYLYAAVNPLTGVSSAMLAPTVNTHYMNEHLKFISRQVAPGSHAILVLDQAGWHVAKALAVPENLALLHLPPYSPKLNPVERVWAYLRSHYLSNRVLPSKPFRFPRTLAREGNRRTVSASRRDIVQAHRPRGPWLGDGLCCPAASTLTMASSEALGPSRRLMALAAGLCLIGRAPEIPQFKLRVFRSVPSPIPRWARWPLAVVVPPVIAFAHY